MAKQGIPLPVDIYLANSSIPNEGLPGQVFNANEIQVGKSRANVNGTTIVNTAYADATNRANVVEKGNGMYTYLLTAAEMSLGLTSEDETGTVVVRVNKAGAVSEQHFSIDVTLYNPGEVASTDSSGLVAAITTPILTAINALPSLASITSALPSLSQISAVVPTAIQNAAAVLASVHDTGGGGRTVRGTLSRMEAYISGKCTGVAASGTATYFKADGITAAFSAIINTVLGNRDAATITNGTE